MKSLILALLAVSTFNAHAIPQGDEQYLIQKYGTCSGIAQVAGKFSVRHSYEVAAWELEIEINETQLYDAAVLIGIGLMQAKLADSVKSRAYEQAVFENDCFEFNF